MVEQQLISKSNSVRVSLARGHWRDYLLLCKPRVVALMILSSVVGMCLAVPGWVSWQILLLGNLGIALAAGSAAALNHLIDFRFDQLMQRTQDRPLVTGRISQRACLLFASVLCVCGIGLLVVFVNYLTAALTFLTVIGYAAIYTIYLKHATPQNIVIGGITGAAPPLLGWVAVTGQINAEALLLMLIIFVWTPPHFWALAIYRIDDYANAGIPMLPNVYGIPYTKLSIFLYTLLLAAISLLPVAINMSGFVYMLGVLGLNSRFIYLAWKLWKNDDRPLAWKTFRYSITYLMMLFVILLIDHYCVQFWSSNIIWY